MVFICFRFVPLHVDVQNTFELFITTHGKTAIVSSSGQIFCYRSVNVIRNKKIKKYESVYQFYTIRKCFQKKQQNYWTKLLHWDWTSIRQLLETKVLNLIYIPSVVWAAVPNAHVLCRCDIIALWFRLTASNFFQIWYIKSPMSNIFYNINLIQK